MLKVMLDTSVYGELVKEQDNVKLLKESGKLIIYGCKIIRRELRDTPKNKLLGNRHLRSWILSLYDHFVNKDEHNFEVTEIIEVIAREYFKEYKAQGGNYSQNDMQNDFLIIACASLHEMDIIVSGDIKSMLGEKAVSAYRDANKRFQLRNPAFKTYKAFIKEIKHLCISSDERSS